jgi:hypothetical protein
MIMSWNGPNVPVRATLVRKNVAVPALTVTASGLKRGLSASGVMSMEVAPAGALAASSVVEASDGIGVADGLGFADGLASVDGLAEPAALDAVTAAADDVPAGWPTEVHPVITLRITAATAKQRSPSDRISLLQTPATTSLQHRTLPQRRGTERRSSDPPTR